MEIFFRRKSNGRSTAGQVAIILIIFLAVGMIAYAAALNFGKISQSKIMTMKAAELGAAMMGSLMASYGEQVYQEQLGGHEKKCAFTAAFLSFLTMIVLIILAVFTAGASATASASMASFLSGVSTGAVVGAVAAGVGAAVQVAVVQPTLTKSWNKMMEGMSSAGMFMEQGIQLALQNAADDTTSIPDLFDYNNDGKFGDLANPLDKTSAPDYLSRFAYLYTNRLARRGQPSTSQEVADFQDALKDLVTQTSMPGDWGLADPYDCSAFPPANMPAICDPCCLPQFGSTDAPNKKGCMVCLNGDIVTPEICTATPTAGQINAAEAFCAGIGTDGEPREGVERLAPECCYNSTGGDGTDCDFVTNFPSTCAARSPYYNGGTNVSPNHYPFVWELIPPEDTTNSAISFREFLGVDDEHANYTVNPRHPNWHNDIDEVEKIKTGTPSHYGDGKQDYSPTTGFELASTSGYYKNLPFPIPSANYAEADQKQGIFPFFYKMRDWFLDLGTLPLEYDGTTVPTAGNVECHWCDYTTASSPYHAYCTPLMTGDNVYELTQNPTGIVNNLQLPTGILANNGGWCVDFKNRGMGFPPTRPDMTPAITSLFADPNVCPLSTPGQWRAGINKYCSDVFPYVEGCAENGGFHHCSTNESLVVDGVSEPLVLNHDCECGDAGAGLSSLFTEDRLDEIVYGIPEFYLWAATIYGNNAVKLSSNLANWYNDAADWIEEPCASPTDPTHTLCPRSYTKLARPGRLWRWKETLQYVYDELNKWLVPESTSTATAASLSVSDSAWCVPTDSVVPNSANMRAPAGEKATFDSQPTGDQGHGIRGDLDDIIACLNWNARDSVVIGAGTVTGNAQKFDACNTGCISSLAGGTMTISDDTLAQLNICHALPRTLLNDAANLWDNYTDTALQLATCRNVIDNHLAGPLPYTNCNTACTGLAGFTPSTAASANSCSSTGTNVFYTGLPAAYAAEVSNSCADPVYSAFLTDSRDNALNQVVKFSKRADFLTARKNEAESIRTGLKIAIDKLDAFLIGDPAVVDDAPAEKLIRERMKDQALNTMPSVAVYIWRDPPRTKPRPGTAADFNGYAHAVKVEGRIPQRCNDACGTNIWPRAKTKNSTFKRCYYLSDTVGMVKMRVIRWDENKPAQSITFPNGMPIWKPKYEHPDSGTPGSFTTVANVCYSARNEILPAEFFDNTLWTNSPGWADLSSSNLNMKVFGDGFMLNRAPSQERLNDPDPTISGEEAAYRSCWEQVHNELLAKGVASESCAQYYFSGSSPGFGVKGFKVKFVPCDHGFRAGGN